MSKYDRVIRSSRVVLPDGVHPAAIAIRDGVIVEIDESSEMDSATATDFGDSVIMPGIVDTHVHINEPGRTDWEGFETATMAAAAGGVTTLIEMPLNSIPATTTRQALRQKVAAAAGKLGQIKAQGEVKKDIDNNQAENRMLIETGKHTLKTAGAEQDHEHDVDLAAKKQAATPEAQGLDRAAKGAFANMDKPVFGI